jgi:hypothetical protein
MRTSRTGERASANPTHETMPLLPSSRIREGNEAVTPPPSARHPDRGKGRRAAGMPGRSSRHSSNTALSRPLVMPGAVRVPGAVSGGDAATAAKNDQLPEEAPGPAVVARAGLRQSGLGRSGLHPQQAVHHHPASTRPETAKPRQPAGPAGCADKSGGALAQADRTKDGRMIWVQVPAGPLQPARLHGACRCR